MEGPEGPDGAVALVEVRRETGRRGCGRCPWCSGGRAATPGPGSWGLQLHKVPRAPPAVELLQWGSGGPSSPQETACLPQGAPSPAALLLSGSRPQRQGAAGEIPFAGRSGTLVQQVFRINRRPAQQRQPLGPGPERGLTGAWA